jgi:RNA polymerase sigma-32 factor
LPKKSKKQTSKTEAPRKVSAEIIEGPNSATKGSLGLEESFEIQDEFPIESSFRPENSSGSDDSNLSPETEEATTYLPATLPSKELRTRDPLVLYLQEIRKYPVLSKEEEFVLAKKYFETKDPQIAQKLVHSNLRFVVKIAAEYSKFGPKMIDLIQEGNVGLMHAVRDFNPYKGARLITYAVWWIRGYIQEYLMRQYSMVRIGTTQNQRKLFYQLQKHKELLSGAHSSEQIQALSQELGIPAEEIEIMAQRLASRDTSLDKKLDEDSGYTVMDFQRPLEEEPLDDLLARVEQLELLREKITDLRPQLSEKEKILLDERILNDQPLTLQEIGEKYDITREAVRQTEARLIHKIRERMLGSHQISKAKDEL